MFGMSPKSDFAQAYKAFGRLALSGERPVIVTHNLITPDLDKLHALQDEFMSGRYREMGLTETDAMNASHRYIEDSKPLSTPIITTTDPTAKDKAILMTWGGDHLGNYMTWLGIKKSFEQSGVNVLSSDTSSSTRSVWIRDTSFILGSTAFLPDDTWGNRYAFDLDVYGELKFSSDEPRTLADRQVEHQKFLEQQGLSTILIDGCFFEGGNLVRDEHQKTIFWGSETSSHSQFRNSFADAIIEATGEEFSIQPVQTDTHHYHLDIGLSSPLPSGHFIVSRGLGYKLGTYESAGLEAVRRHVSRDKLIEQPRDICLDYFLTNCVSVGTTVFMTGCPDDLRKRLEDLGNIVNAPSEEQIKDSAHRYEPSALRRIGSAQDGGGLRCMTQEAPLLSLG